MKNQNRLTKLLHELWFPRRDIAERESAAAARRPTSPRRCRRGRPTGDQLGRAAPKSYAARFGGGRKWRPGDASAASFDVPRHLPATPLRDTLRAAGKFGSRFKQMGFPARPKHLYEPQLGSVKKKKTKNEGNDFKTSAIS